MASSMRISVSNVSVKVSDGLICAVQRQRLTKSIGNLLQNAEEVNVLAADLGGGALLVKVLLVHVFLVGRGLEEGHVDIKVIGHLNGTDQPGVCEC